MKNISKMQIVKIVYTDIQGNKRIIDKEQEKYTYKDMREILNMIYINFGGQIKAYLKNKDIEIFYRKSNI